MSILFTPLSALRGWRQAGLSNDMIEIVKININIVSLAGVANVGRGWLVLLMLAGVPNVGWCWLRLAGVAKVGWCC